MNRKNCKSCGGTGEKEDKTLPLKDEEGYKWIPCPKCGYDFYKKPRLVTMHVGIRPKGLWIVAAPKGVKIDITKIQVMSIDDPAAEIFERKLKCAEVKKETPLSSIKSAGSMSNILSELFDCYSKKKEVDAIIKDYEHVINEKVKALFGQPLGTDKLRVIYDPDKLTIFIGSELSLNHNVFEKLMECFGENYNILSPKSWNGFFIQFMKEGN